MHTGGGFKLPKSSQALMLPSIKSSYCFYCAIFCLKVITDRAARLIAQRCVLIPEPKAAFRSKEQSDGIVQISMVFHDHAGCQQRPVRSLAVPSIGKTRPVCRRATPEHGFVALVDRYQDWCGICVAALNFTCTSSRPKKRAVATSKAALIMLPTAQI